MHINSDKMKELTRTRRLTIATIVFVFILIIGFLTFRNPTFVYNLTPEEMLTELSNSENTISPDELSNIMANSKDSYVFVDIRNPYDYARGYLDEAINIPVSEILADESISFFDEMKNKSEIIVLYGKDQSEANGPWMLIKQLGYDNVKILLGGFDYLNSKKNISAEMIEIPEIIAEQPIADFGEFKKHNSDANGKVSSPSNKSNQIIPIKRQKKSKTSGGC